MARGREPAAASQHHLGAHEFAVVFADGPLHPAKAGIGAVGTGGPLATTPGGRAVCQRHAGQGRVPIPLRWEAGHHSSGYRQPLRTSSDDASVPEGRGGGPPG